MTLLLPLQVLFVDDLRVEREELFILVQNFLICLGRLLLNVLRIRKSGFEHLREGVKSVEVEVRISLVVRIQTGRIVDLPFLFVAESFISLSDLKVALFGLGRLVYVGMILLRQLEKALLDFIL